MKDEHKKSLPESLRASLEDKLKQFLTGIAPFRTPLTPAERKKMAIAGDKTLSFIEKTKEYAELYPELVPPWLDKAHFLEDYTDYHNFIAMRNLADQIHEAVYDMHYTASSDVYSWSRDFYHYVLEAASNNVPNAEAVADDMGKRYEKGGRKPAKE